jgi:hypothetical protein
MEREVREDNTKISRENTEEHLQEDIEKWRRSYRKIPTILET